jgi:hypothetical protein
MEKTTANYRMMGIGQKRLRLAAEPTLLTSTTECYTAEVLPEGFRRIAPCSSYMTEYLQSTGCHPESAAEGIPEEIRRQMRSALPRTPPGASAVGSVMDSGEI